MRLLQNAEEHVECTVYIIGSGRDLLVCTHRRSCNWCALFQL